MKIEITYRCRVDGKEYLPGDIVETSKGVALDRIGMKRAKPYVEPASLVPEGEEGNELAQVTDGATTDPGGVDPGGKKGKKGERK